MDYNMLNIGLVIAFLVFNLIIGLLAGRGVTTMREYVLGNGSFGIISIFLTILATDLGGTAVFGATGFYFSQGIAAIISETIYPLTACFVLALFIIPRFRKNNNWLTIGDIMQSSYGRYAGIITGVFGFIHSTCCAGLEIFALKKIFELFLGITSVWVVVGTGMLLAIYAVLGGMKSITTTDTFKFIIFAVGIPIIAYVVSTKAGGIIEVLDKLPEEKFNDLDVSAFSKNLPNIIFSLLPFCLTCPSVIQRILMSNNIRQLRSMFFIYGISCSAFLMVFVIIALSVLKLSPSLPSDQVIPYAIGLLPIGFKSLAILALVSIVVSTIDSMLNIAGVTIMHDVIRPLMKKEKQESINELKWTRIATLFISIIAIIVGLKTKNALDFLGGIFYFTGPITLFPIITAIIGIKVDSKSYFCAAGGTLIAYIFTTFFLPVEYSNFILLIHLVTNAVIFFTSLLIINGGRIVFLRDWEPLDKNKKNNFTTVFMKILSFPLHIASYSREKVQAYGAPYVLFAVFCIVNYVLPFFLWTSSTSLFHNEIFFIRILGGLFLCLLLVKEKWPKFLIPYLPLYWHFVLAYVLPFTGTIMFLATHASVEWLINIALSIMFLVALVDWVSFFIISVLGIGLGICVFIFHIGGGISLNLDFETEYLLLYQIFFATVIGLLFARRKRVQTEELESGKKYAKELYELATQRLNYNELGSLRISKSLGDLNMDIIKKMNNVRVAIEHGDSDIAEEYLDILESDIVNVVVTEENCLKLHVESIDLKDLRMALGSLCKDNFGYDVTINLRCKFSKIKCDKMALLRIISQAIADLKVELSLDGRTLDNTSILIDISDTNFRYSLSSLDEYFRVVKAVRFVISTIDPIDNSLLKSEYQKQLVDAFKLSSSNGKASEKIITENYLEAHYGSFEQIKLGQNIMKIYVLPQDVHEIRPIGLDVYAPEEDVLNYWPEAMDREIKFKYELSIKAPNIKWENVQKALNFIRRYHAHQIRHSGEPYYLHPIAVARLLLNIMTTVSSEEDTIDFVLGNNAGKDILKKINTRLSKTCNVLQQKQEDVIIAALLHDILENTATNPLSIESIFGSEVASYVLAVAKITCSEISQGGVEEKKFEELLNHGGPIPICVKIADRLHNIYTIDSNPDAKQRCAMAKETLSFFIEPVKNLGFDEIAKDLEGASDHILKYGKLEGFEFKASVMEFLKFQWSFIKN